MPTELALANVEALADKAAQRIYETIPELLRREAGEEEHYETILALRRAVDGDRNSDTEDGEARKALVATLSDAQRRLFGDYKDAHTAVESVVEDAAFALGLALGRRLAGAR